MVCLRALLAQAGEQMVRAGMVARHADQRLERGLGLVDAAEEIECDGEVVAIFAVIRL